MNSKTVTASCGWFGNSNDTEEQSSVKFVARGRLTGRSRNCTHGPRPACLLAEDSLIASRTSPVADVG
jgi:hypothetical protein